MGLSLFAYFLLGITGSWLLVTRKAGQPRPGWLRPFHFITGGTMVLLVLLLLAIGLVGTIGHYGSLGHSTHLPSGLIVVSLTLFSAWAATQISPERPWARRLHLGTNLVLLLGFAIVTWTGWDVVQKYLP
jgi:hypothetical protein